MSVSADRQGPRDTEVIEINRFIELRQGNGAMQRAKVSDIEMEKFLESLICEYSILYFVQGETEEIREQNETVDNGKQLR